MSEANTNHNPAKSTRRRLLGGAALAAAITALAGGIGAKVYAHGGYGGWHRGGFMGGPNDPAALDERMDRMLKHFYVEIDATEEQKARLAPIVKQAAKDLLPLREKLRAARSRAVELLTQDRIDRVSIEALRTEQLQLAEEASRRLTQALADAAEVLTPAQRKALAAHIERRRGGWRHG